MVRAIFQNREKASKAAPISHCNTDWQCDYGEKCCKINNARRSCPLMPLMPIRMRKCWKGERCQLQINLAFPFLERVQCV